MIGQSVGKSYAYILGVYLGDGCVTRSSAGTWVFRLNTIDEDFAASTRRALNDLSKRAVTICKHSVKKSSKPNYALVFGDQNICIRLRDDTDLKRRIPEYIMSAPRDEKLAFIAGLMDSEGFVAATNRNPTNRRYYMGYKSCDVWVPEFAALLESVGVRYGKVGIEKPLKPGYKTPMRFTIKMQSWIDAGCYFNIARKQTRVDEWNAAGAYERRSRYPRRLASETTRQTLERVVI